MKPPQMRRLCVVCTPKHPVHVRFSTPARHQTFATCQQSRKNKCHLSSFFFSGPTSKTAKNGKVAAVGAAPPSSPTAVEKPRALALRAALCVYGSAKLASRGASRRALCVSASPSSSSLSSSSSSSSKAAASYASWYVCFAAARSASFGSPSGRAACASSRETGRPYRASHVFHIGPVTLSWSWCGFRALSVGGVLVWYF